MAKNREFLQLAQTYDPAKHVVSGWYASEKLDGMRAFWDGGITNGMPAAEVPWANTAKDSRLKNEVFASGLWSRYGKPIHAPAWWLMALPAVPLDGELYIGPQMFETTMSTVKKLEAIDSEWENIQFMVFDLPSTEAISLEGKINNPNFSRLIDSTTGDFFAVNHCVFPRYTFEQSVHVMERLNLTGHVRAHWQEKLPYGEAKARARIDELMDDIIARGGEGLILRHECSIWEPRRSQALLKVKPESDSEATVVGYVWGRGKFEGLMGAMKVEWHGVSFELGTGFNDRERVLVATEDPTIPVHGPGGCEVSPNAFSAQFPRGSVVTFRYRELTNAGIPKEARYFRKG